MAVRIHKRALSILKGHNGDVRHDYLVHEVTKNSTRRGVELGF